MKVWLMHPDRDFRLEGELPPHAADLVQDLELERLFAAMAQGDRFLLEVARKALLESLSEPEAVAYRQEVLRDALARPQAVRELYELAVAAGEDERRIFPGFLSRSPDSVLYRSVQLLELLVKRLRELRELADRHGDAFRSRGFRRLFATLREELDERFFAAAEEHLKELKFREGVLISAALGPGLRGRDYVLRRPLRERRGWLDRLLGKGRPAYSFEIAPRDESGARALAELRDRGLAGVARALAQSTDHILDFFAALRTELAFYLGALHLRDELAARGLPTCIPEALPPGRPALSARGLYDVALALRLEGGVVGNDVAADGKRLVVVTGANQGGKSTFLRSVGLAQLMLQCGLFVGAERFSADLASGIFTHFKREEDPSLRGGKLDEELRRMSAIVDAIRPGALLLCNESFASTNEREGSEIARQIVRAMLEAGVKVFFVTHLYGLAEGFHREGREEALFLRAERQVDGRRTFRMVEGAPLPTSFGEDLYRRIFGPAGGGDGVPRRASAELTS
ncbi:MAG: DNA mismatch repair protein MutS [Clostridia bacterium]|nr:DNA mismatch repair protein MutS [Clostridia bacterium]